MKIDRLDHLVLTVASVERSCDFYCGALGMTKVVFGAGRTALQFGRQKINLHQVGEEILPRAHRPTPGSADFCLISAEPLDVAIAHLTALGVVIDEGPVVRTGAMGSINSIYFRDPDQNLIEISNYVGDSRP